MFAVLEIIVIAFLLLFANKRKNIYHSEKIKLTDKISVPKPVGEGQHGTSWWLDKKYYNKVFKCNVIDRNKKYNSSCFDSGGVIVNFEKDGNIEKYYYIDDNIPLAESLINDIVNILVEKNDKTEPIWKNGEQSVIKTALMAVILENKGKREYQTLANAYYFVAEMFKPDKDGKLPIDKYMENKEANDPIKKFYAVARNCTK